MTVFTTTPTASASATPTSRPSRADRSYSHADMTTPLRNMTTSTPMAPRKALRMGAATKRPALPDRITADSPIFWPSAPSTPVMTRTIRTPSAPMKSRISRQTEQGPIPLQMLEETPSRVVASFANLDMEENMRTPGTAFTPSHPTKRARVDSFDQMVPLADRLDVTHENGWSTVPLEKIHDFREFVASKEWSALDAPMAPLRTNSRRVSLSDRMTNASRMMQEDNGTNTASRLSSDRLTGTPTRRWNVIYNARRGNALNTSRFMTSPVDTMDVDEQNEAE